VSGPSQTLRVRVRYSETDQMGVVYHAHYLVWMEVGRTELLRALGHPYDEIERAGLLFAVSDLSCRFAGAARYGEVVTVTTEIAEVRSRDVRFAYRISGERGNAVASGTVRVVALDRDLSPRRIPEALLADLRACCAGDPARSFEEVLLT
jgi:acyl-CoA thioester hydrolase